MIVRLNPALAGYTIDRLPGLYRQLQDRFNRMPGVLSASLALHSPMDGWNWSDQVWIQGRQPAVNAHDDNAIYDYVSAHYFETIGTHLLRGRGIEERDTPASRRVAVVNDVLAHKFFSNEDPIGKHLGFNGFSHSGDYEIVGVVENTKYVDPKILPTSGSFCRSCKRWSTMRPPKMHIRRGQTSSMAFSCMSPAGRKIFKGRSASPAQRSTPI